MTNSLNPEALEAACAGFYNDPMGLTNWHKLCAADPALADKYRAGMNAAVSAYLAAATPGMDTDTLACKIMWKDLPFGGNPDNYIRLDANAAHAVIELLRPHLAALPAPRTIEGVYDLGSPEPEGVDQVIECDEHGNPYDRDPEGSNDPTWSKTIDGTRWKGYKDGKEYRDWGDLVRRYGPVIDVRWVPTEGCGE